ncbi:hypothetical protein L3Y34_013261 [Caenorhabditis briggsae]|uniref:Uncharacterized protein n=1 Tax=Caenorhabditis briggsae TaxID=6238 RepID=A0AAE8ZR93_CAEBR|nr:hypothetical protein L3Y34_013261 [Caenorhabditis briggsae]
MNKLSYIPFLPSSLPSFLVVFFCPTAYEHIARWTLVIKDEDEGRRRLLPPTNKPSDSEGVEEANSGDGVDAPAHQTPYPLSLSRSSNQKLSSAVYSGHHIFQLLGSLPSTLPDTE